MDLAEKLARMDERLTIARWIRQRTHLRSLAQLLEDRVDQMSVKEQTDYCARHKMGRLK